ncbi:hypothetical protein DFS34DRAFT_610849 [Phlyctochytrium arcticum]|nr:hypothetical protein DFS34DRAFT_610849 [Phlyctochytrium arcticum]
MVAGVFLGHLPFILGQDSPISGYIWVWSMYTDGTKVCMSRDRCQPSCPARKRNPHLVPMKPFLRPSTIHFRPRLTHFGEFMGLIRVC